jgi:hypothetical protein
MGIPNLLINADAQYNKIEKGDHIGFKIEKGDHIGFK